MKKKLRTGLMCVLAGVLVFCLGGYFYQLYQYRQGEESYADAAQIAGIPPDLDPEVPLTPVPVTPTPSPTGAPSPDLTPDPGATPQPEDPSPPENTPLRDPYISLLELVDLSALQAVNDDVVGWLLIPGTKVSYPIVLGEDNQYYLHHDWQNRTASVGAIFLNHTSAPDFTDFHTLIFGHRMRNQSMFGSLGKYADQSFYDAYPDVYVAIPGQVLRYRIFAAYSIQTDQITYQIGFQDREAKAQFLRFCLSHSQLNTGLVPTPEDSILTLSTCTGNSSETWRWVVQAVYQPDGA